MTKAAPAQVNFNGGLLSAFMDARYDIAAYANGLSVCRNMLPILTGGNKRRQGSRFKARTKTQSQRSWLLSFNFGKRNTFVLEFGNHYIRFFRNGVPVKVGGVPYEVTTPWTEAQLFDDAGLFQLDYVQSNDVIYITHPDFVPRVLTHFADDNWTIRPIEVSTGPFEDINTDKTKTITVSALTGTITITASDPIFDAKLLNTYIYMETDPYDETSTVVPWEVGITYEDASIITSAGHTYNLATTDLPDGLMSGTERPIHTSGVRKDGFKGFPWRYLHSGNGIAKITGYISPTQVTAEVVTEQPTKAKVIDTQLPFIGGVYSTFLWAFGKWNPLVGFPQKVCFFKQRTTFGRNDDLDFSVTGDYENFSRKDFGELTPDMGFSLKVLGGGYNGISWMIPKGDLYVGTEASEFVLQTINKQLAFSATNALVPDPQTDTGALPIKPVVMDSDIMFIENGGDKIRAFQYDLDSNAFAGLDLTIMSEEVLESGVTGMARQKKPDTNVWVSKKDGSFAALTYNKKQQISGWSAHDLGGGGSVECVTCCLDAEGIYTDMYLLVRRVINGQTARYIEHIPGKYWRKKNGISEAVFLDCAVTIRSTDKITEITGLEHLEGATAAILADGAVRPPQTVTDGKITLIEGAKIIHVGLPYRSEMRSMKLEFGSALGVAQGRPKKLAETFFRFFETVGAKYGYDENNLEIIPFRDSGMQMNTAVVPFSGDKRMHFHQGWNRDAYMTVVQDDPLPCTLLAWYFNGETSERVGGRSGE